MMYKRYISVAILLNMPACLFAAIGNFFIKTGYVCNFDNSDIILQSTDVLFGLCALSCLEDNRCFSFQHNKQTQQCYTTTRNIYGVQTCVSATNDNEIAYVKGVRGFRGLFGQNRLIGGNNNVAAFVASQDDYAPDGNNYYWFGGTRVTGTENPGTWKWQDGTDVRSSNWFHPYPNGDPTRMCMFGRVSGESPARNGEWGDNSCTSHESYVCEITP